MNETGANPLEKIRADIAYWESVIELAHANIAAGEAMLPPLRAFLERHDIGTLTGNGQEPGAYPAVGFRPEDLGPRFSGRTCREQVAEALRWKSPQSSDDLVENLTKYGTAFGAGAVGYALRDLLKAQDVRRVTKLKNAWLYEPVED